MAKGDTHRYLLLWTIKGWPPALWCLCDAPLFARRAQALLEKRVRQSRHDGFRYHIAKVTIPPKD